MIKNLGESKIALKLCSYHLPPGSPLLERQRLHEVTRVHRRCLTSELVVAAEGAQSTTVDLRGRDRVVVLLEVIADAVVVTAEVTRFTHVTTPVVAVLALDIFGIVGHCHGVSFVGFLAGLDVSG